jgi:hypothetical protein
VNSLHVHVYATLLPATGLLRDGPDGHCLLSVMLSQDKRDAACHKDPLGSPLAGFMNTRDEDLCNRRSMEGAKEISRSSHKPTGVQESIVIGSLPRAASTSTGLDSSASNLLLLKVQKFELMFEPMFEAGFLERPHVLSIQQKLLMFPSQHPLEGIRSTLVLIELRRMHYFWL